MNRRFTTMSPPPPPFSRGRRAFTAELKLGTPAPAFSAVNSEGKTVNLSDYRGKTIVLEWTNDGCPYVRKHYGSGNMQALQKKWTDQGIVWLSVIPLRPASRVCGCPRDESYHRAQGDADCGVAGSQATGRARLRRDRYAAYVHHQAGRHARLCRRYRRQAVDAHRRTSRMRKTLSMRRWSN